MKPVTRERALRAVEKSLLAIHNDPASKHKLEQLAAAAGLSTNRFHTLFREITGEPVGAYVRRARIEYAVRELRASPSLSLTRAALRAGYSELSDFSRAFKGVYGCSPNEWDRRSTLKHNKKCQALFENNVYLSNELPGRPAAHGETVSIRNYASLRLAVLNVPNAAEGTNLADAFTAMEEWLLARDQIMDSRNFIGLSHSDLFSAGPDTMRFDLAYPVDKTINASGTLVIRTIPDFVAAVVHCEGGFEDFVSAWDRLHREWLPASDYVPANKPTMEIYFDDPRPSGMTVWNMDCVLPIEKTNLRSKGPERRFSKSLGA